MTAPTGDQALIKRMNTAIVLDHIYRGSPLSRAQISDKSGLNKATVSSLVEDLIGSSLVKEIGIGISSGGRKPVLLEFNANSGSAIGVDLGVNYIRSIRTDLRGNLLSERIVSLNDGQVDFVLQELERCIEELMAEALPSPYGVVGIGIGVPGLIDEGGSVLFAPNLGWRDIPLRRILSDRFGIPVMIDNEANAGAVGEQIYGAGVGIRNLVYVSAGIGIGTGLILQGQLYRGASGFSGEMGHISVEAFGKPCSCGNRGCWEIYASERALLEKAASLGYSDLEGLLAAAQSGREAVIALLNEIGEYLGVGIANIINVFNPDAVMIGNRMSQAREWIEPSIRSTIVQRTLGHHLRNVHFMFAELQERSAVRGAAHLALAAFFERFHSGR